MSFYFFRIAQDLNEIKKNRAHPFVDIGKLETCAKLQEKILNWRVVGASRSFQIFRHDTVFLENNRALSNCLSGILHYSISIVKL